MPPSNDFTRWGLSYAALGWRIIPLSWVILTDRGARCSCRDGVKCEAKGKHPLIPEWQTKASNDPERIKAWGGQWPRAGIAILTGVAGGQIVLDQDGDAANTFLDQNPPPLTPTVKTGRGFHFHLKATDRPLRSFSKKQGLDLKAENSYAIAPPTIHESGIRYEWIEGLGPRIPLAEPPAWLLTIAEEGGPPSVVGGGGWGEVRPILEGGRNTTLARIAGYLRRAGAGGDEILATLVLANRRCGPPLTDRTLYNIVKSITRYPPHDTRREDNV